MKRSVIITGSALLGLVAGMGLRELRRKSGSDAAANGAASLKSTAAASLPPGSSNSRKPPTTPLTEQLAADLSQTDPVLRWLHWMAAVEKATAADFPSLARLAKDLPGAVAMLGARWVEIDPEGVFKLCTSDSAEAGGVPADELLGILYTEWPKKDPAGMLAALKSTPGLNQFKYAHGLEPLFQIDPEHALIAMSQLNVTSYGPRMDGVKKWAAQNPRHAAEVAMANPAGYASEEVLKTVGKVWSTSDPRGAMDFLAGQNTRYGRMMADEVIKGWVSDDIGKASEWFAGADEKSRARLLPAFIEAWGRKDAAEALQWSFANTEGTQQTAVITSLIKGVAHQSPAKAAEIVAGMEPSPLRAGVAEAFVESINYTGDWWPNMNTPGAKVKPEAIAWLNQLDAGARGKVMMTLGYSWGTNDPEGFLAYAQTPQGRDASPDALANAMAALSRSKPEAAMKIAGGYPDSDLVINTFSGWVRSQPEAAMDWLRTLPPGDARREKAFLGAVSSAVPYTAFGSGPESNGLTRQQLAAQLSTDPAAALKTINALPISDAERARVVSQLRLR